jgi:hypothetical protein
MRGPWVSNTQGPLIELGEMIKMAALGLLLIIVVVTAIVYIAGLVWLARLDVREDESAPQETISPNLPNQRYRRRQATLAR